MTRTEAVKEFFKKAVLPVAIAGLLYCIFKSACIRNGELDLLWLWILCGLPFGIHRMCVWFVPGGGSYSVGGYAAHMPNERDDQGVISPTAALSSIVYTPEQSLAVMRHLYEMSEKSFGPYAFYDAFSETDNWYPKRYLAIDQGPIAVMIENYRTGLLWKLFMSHPDVQNGLQKLGFSINK